MVTGRTSVARWARGAVIALLAALAVLIHHETATVAATSMQQTAATHVGHAMPGMASSSAAAVPHGSSADKTAGVDAATPAHGADGSACAEPGMQHCTAASVDTVKLAPPPHGHAEPAAIPHQAKHGRPPTATISRAPPDLSVLSQLRI